MQQSNEAAKKPIVRVKDLPLYTDSLSKPQVYVALVKEKNDFERGITEVRQRTFEFIDLFSEQTERAREFYKCTLLHARRSMDYVSSESNILPKLAIITASGLTGVLLGIRRSNFRRFTYSVSLMGASAALCYPNEAKHYGGQAYDWSKVNLKQLYNEYVMPSIGKDVTTSSGNFKEVANVGGKDKIVAYTPKQVEKSSGPNDFAGDKGQSKDEDAGFYTTRK